MPAEATHVAGSFWLFGYGSLMWRAEFAFDARCRARVRGWQRRFWQGSTDHRGVPGAPGRVVTLVRAPRASCWGIAYRLQATEMERILGNLDLREQNGYERTELELELGDGQRVRGLTYVAGPDNPHYLGPAPLAAIARQIAAAEGPSGSNLDYLSALYAALEDMGRSDRHVAALHARVARPRD